MARGDVLGLDGHLLWVEGADGETARLRLRVDNRSVLRAVPMRDEGADQEGEQAGPPAGADVDQA